MDPNYYESILKHLKPKFIIDDRLEIEKELIEQFNSKYLSLFQTINKKLRNKIPTKNDNKTIGYFRNNFGVNSKTNNHSLIDISVGMGNEFKTPLHYYNVKLKEEGVSFLGELIFTENIYAEKFLKQFKTKVEPRFDEFPYFQKLKKVNSVFCTHHKNNKVCLEIFIPLKFYDDLANIIKLTLYDEFNFGFLAKISILDGINLRSIQNLSKEKFFQNLINNNISLEIKYENYVDIFKAFTECDDYSNNDDIGSLILKIMSFCLIIQNFDLNLDLNILNDKLLQFLCCIGIDATPLEYWKGVLYEEAIDLKQLFLDVITNICEHLGISPNVEYITGFNISRLINKAKIIFSIGASEIR